MISLSSSHPFPWSWSRYSNLPLYFDCINLLHSLFCQLIQKANGDTERSGDKTHNTDKIIHAFAGDCSCHSSVTPKQRGSPMPPHPVIAVTPRASPGLGTLCRARVLRIWVLVGPTKSPECFPGTGTCVQLLCVRVTGDVLFTPPKPTLISIPRGFSLIELLTALTWRWEDSFSSTEMKELSSERCCLQRCASRRNFPKRGHT